MALLKKYYKANSILESVIALTIITICIYIAISVYANVFSIKTSAIAYNKQNIVNQQFYESQLQSEPISIENFEITENWLNTNLKEIVVHYKDSSGIAIKNKFYLYSNE